MSTHYKETFNIHNKVNANTGSVWGGEEKYISEAGCSVAAKAEFALEKGIEGKLKAPRKASVWNMS